MAKILVLYILTLLLFANFECEVYQDRPKIKTSDGDLILEPAYDKSIFLRPNGPKSTVYVGEVNILDVKSKPAIAQHQEVTHNDLQEMLLINGPNGILKRLEKLESKSLSLSDDLFLNISTIWRRVNNLQRKVNNLQTLINNRAKDECESQPCQHGGTCLNIVNGYHCLCPNNWEGKDCDVDVNECRNFAGTDLGCQNGATCINKPGYYECLCRSGWFGLHCTRKAKDCSGGDFEMCGHGTCVKVDTGEGVTCICHQGWTTNGTGVACLTDVNECDSHQGSRCSVNPKVDCINLPGSFRCGQCPHGYEGDGYTCSDIDECVTLPNGGCSSMVACTNTIGSRICGPCPPGYQGDGVTCTWRGSCQINNGECHPSARCVELMSIGRDVQCVCPDGMDGDGVGLHGCYIAVGNNLTRSCENNPCIHGQCHVVSSGYTCICETGYGGRHCDVAANVCLVNPCRNGGTCRQDRTLPAGFRCECTAQYSGSLCDLPSRTCGGVLDNEEGTVVYPPTNSTYAHNSKCVWLIRTAENKVINVTFSKFNMEGGDDCPYDFLQIHDGPTPADLLIGRFCGNTLPNGGNIISNRNYLYFWFRSDGTVAKEGFALHWTSVNPVCGGRIDANINGHIESPGSPGKYPPNRDCFWNLRTRLGKKIQLLFFALDIEKHSNCSFDYIAIYDGSRQTDPLLSKYCNSDLPPSLLSAGSDILIHFHSDAYGSGKGFQLAYAPAPGIPGCGGYFTQEQGEISAPAYNGTYLTNMLCEYKIQTSPGTKVRIEISQFNLEWSARCRFDYLKIYDGPSETSPLVGKFCGTAYPKSYVSSSNTLYIIFHSDVTVSLGGFKILYKALCQQTLVGDSGVIKSPGYPFSYPANKVCEYFIVTTPGKAIKLTFQDFDIEDNRYYNCQYDNVEIRDGTDVNSTLLGRYCGGSEHTPPEQISTHNHMYVRFNSDMSISGTGFYANYTTLATECGGIYRDTTGLINHPSGESASYKNDQTCTWILVANPGMHIKLTWHRFEIEHMPSCDSDYLELTEIDEHNSNYTLGKFCGTKTPPAFTTSTNRLIMNFKSDSSIRSAGFSVSYTFLDDKAHCGGILYKTHGFIYSPGWPNRYEPNRDCIWVITVPVGQQIRLNISQFDLERPIRGTCNSGDYIELRNGATQNSPLIGQYCGKFQTRLIKSVANSLHIRFHSDSYLTGYGFKMEWDGTAVGCGGTLTSSSGTISSPNYPETYNENTECFYKIVTSFGSRIRLSFVDLELERTTKCRDDYVEIFDGKDFDSKSLGKHCIMNPGLNNIETTRNYAMIKFRSDSYIVAKGFMLNYHTDCNNNLTGTYGVIESLDYPNEYPLNLNCNWNINVPKGNRINVTFSHFDIFNHFTPSISIRNPYAPSRYYYYHNRIGTSLGQCQNDYLQWKETSDSHYSKTFCGSTAPTISTKTNALQIKFATGSFGARTGFRLEWKSYGCGGHIQKRYGSISIDRDIITSGEIECEWLIETDVGRSVSLIVTDIFVKETNDCSTDFVEVYNGQDSNSPLLSRICNRHITTLQSTSNLMLVKFVKSSSLRGAYFTSTFTSPKAKCGGYITSLSGYIYSPNYPKNYDSNLNCRWIISVPANHRIELNFLEFDLYSTGRKDCYDSIKILDSPYLVDSNTSEIICPDSNKKQILTKHNSVVFQFKSNDSGNAKGFKVNFTVTCGAYITASSDGVISNEYYIGGSNKTCTWYIRAPQPDQKISLTITHIYLPTFVENDSNRSCSSSYLRVYNGDDTDAPLIDEYCGKKSPPMIVSQGSAIAVSLGSYINQTTGHFSAHYSPVSETCGGQYSSEEGTIASPNYPRSYPVSANCEWILITSPGNKVYLTFEVFDLEYSEGCNEDYLEIREDNGGGKLLGVYCGSDIPLNTSTAKQLYIKFHSNDENSGKGFLMHYGFLHGNELINSERGEIASPLYPHLYFGASTYTWRVQSEGPEGIVITVDILEIPSYRKSCTNYLSIYDGYDDTAPLLSTLCGKLPNPTEVIQTSSNMAFIKLSLDESNSGAQFHLKWAKTDVDTNNIEERSVNCGLNHTILVSPGNFSTFKSPHYPNEYDNDLNCEWTFEATSGRHLKLNFIEFEIEETNHCFADSISVYSADIPGQWKLIEGNFCDEEKATKLEANSSKYMKVVFNTDSSITRKGFQGKVSSVCGGLITELSGEIGPTWDDVRKGRFINTKLNCEWVVKVRPGRLINLEFKHFNISNTDHCLTFVSVKNGDSAEAPPLSAGTYCGYSHENTNVKLTTSSNSLFISYTTNNDKFSRGAFQNFKIRYEEQNVECGGVLELNEDQNSEIISSPNYPNTPIPYSECIWIVKGPPGEILRVDFIDRFDLDNINNCETEVVEFHDGSSSLSPSLGRFCGETPSTIKTKNNALYVKYLTQISEPRNGFKANISIDVCGGTIVAESGEIKSPNYPHMINIPYNTICEWRIKGPANHVFTIIPQDINLPESESHCATNVVIQEDIIGTGPNNTSPSKITQILKDFCDVRSVGNAIESSTNEVVIKYYSGKPSDFPMTWRTNTGFRFTFNSKRPICGGSITTPEGFITTPGYPFYTQYRYCSWSIVVPDSSRRIKLELLDMDADKHTIGIYNDNIYQSLIQPVSNPGNNLITRVYESSGNKLSLFLWLNRSSNRHRFKARFSSEQESLCGGNLQGLSGTLNSINIDRSYSCEWHYDSSVGLPDSDYNTILLTASVNSSTTSQTPGRCRYSDPKINIKANIFKLNTIFSKDLCGIINNESFRIPHTAIDIKATKSSSFYLFFRLEYKAQPCGGVISVNESPVNIINIPSTENDTLDCAWIVSSPYNTRTELKMEGFFQYGCDDEYLKISQGLMFSTPIGTYCKETVLSQPLLINFKHIYVEYHTKATNSSKLKLMTRTEKDTCGGQLTQYRNVFSSPNYPKHYESNEECSWIITAEEGSRVSLRFIERFVVENAPNCTKDVVIIYDWKDDKYNEMARICGREILGPYNSSYNQMKVVLRTNGLTNLDGFKAVWTPICGGNYTATDKNQTLSSPGFTRAYPSMAYCKYEISAPKDKKVMIKFLEFDLEGSYPSCLNDNVTITAEDDNAYERFISINCGTDLPYIPSKYNKVSILFQSDRFVQKRGFKLVYQTYECGGEVKEPTVLTSHLGDGAYDDNMNCTWIIKAPTNKLIVFKFIYVDLENNDECYMDSVAIYEGLLIDDDKRLALLCGHDMNSSTVLRSRGSNALLSFKSDHSNTFTGFKVAISFTYGGSVGCGGQIDLTQSSTTTLKSPLIGSNVVYENFLDCHWTLKSPPDTVIQVEFLSFHISPCANVNQTALGVSNCKCDFVELRDGLNPDSLIMGTYCGHTLPPSLHSLDNVLNVRLSTDGELTSSGFEARLSVQPNVCGQTRFTIKEKSTRVKSPGYESGIIPRGLRCIYHFDGESSYYGQTVHISITNLDIQRPIEENGIKTCTDKFIIASSPKSRNITVGRDYILSNSVDSFLSSYYYYEIEDNSLPKQLEYCGPVKHSDIYVTGSIEIILITSPESDSNTLKGVEFEVSVVGFCGMNYTGTQGRIQTLSPRIYEEYDDENENIEDCYTLITAPDNHTISAYFMFINPSYWNDNVFLNVYDGKETSSNKLITVNKDYSQTLPVFSTGKYLLFHNHAITDEHVQYELVYTTTDKGRGCGGKLSNVLGRVTSPMFPETYREVSKCEWELETPTGTRLKLHFQAFYFGRSCDQNYLELIDSKGNLISTYCEEQPADYTSADNYVKIVFHTTKNNGGQGWMADFVGIV